MENQKINLRRGAVCRAYCSCNAHSSKTIAKLPRPASKKHTNNQGITLIALVVTVIVLLILAGITLSLIGGSEGILGRATSAVEENEKATAKEQAELAIQEIQMSYMEEKYVNDSNAQTKKDYILDKLKDGVQTQDYYIQATEDGKVIIYEGSDNTGREISKVFVDDNGSIQWQEDILTYTIAYNGNGATEGNMQASVCNYDEQTTLTANGFARANHKFLGWNTAADGSGTTYEDGQSILNLTERGYVLTLYAQWKENPKATTTIANSNFGEYVDYSANGVSDWRIFLNDGSNVYLISSYYVPNSGISSGIGLSKVGSYGVYGGSGLAGILANASNWTSYTNGTSNGKKVSGLSATGGPTISQFYASFNRKFGTNFSSYSQSFSAHYGFSDTLYRPHSYNWGGCSGWGIATYWDRRGSLGVLDSGKIDSFSSGKSCPLAVRVLICLPSNAIMRKEGNKWIIET